MRRRLTVAISAVVAGTLVLTVAGGLLLVQRASISTAENELTSQVESVGDFLSTHAATGDQNLIRVLKKVGSYQFLATDGLSPSGVFESLPAPLEASDMDVSALQDDEPVAGNVGRTVFVAVPIALGIRERILHGIPDADLPVLVVTRNVPSPVNALPYYLLVAGIVLLIGALVAAILARRISAPLLRAVETTRDIASGDLEARVPVGRREAPELAELAEAINSMGDSLGRSRGLERQFLLSVSHELRTPLTSIRGYADAVADGTAEDVVGAAGVIGSESRRLERLVQDLLELARLDAHQFSLHLQRVDAAIVVEGVAEGFLPEATSLGLSLESTVPAGAELWVDADPDRLAQIVANLLENAFKFASSRVEVGAGTNGTHTCLWVTDDGPGISAQDLPHVFARHFRSDRVPTRKLGSGLGLAIVAQLAAAMGASVSAQSPLPGGGGTSMVMSMTTRVAPTDGRASPTSVTPSSPPTRHDDAYRSRPRPAAGVAPPPPPR